MAVFTVVCYETLVKLTYILYTVLAQQPAQIVKLEPLMASLICFITVRIFSRIKIQIHHLCVSTNAWDAFDLGIVIFLKVLLNRKTYQTLLIENSACGMKKHSNAFAENPLSPF